VGNRACFAQDAGSLRGGGRGADRRVYPAVDVNRSGTRKEELLRTEDESRLVYIMHKILSDMNPGRRWNCF